MDEARRSLGVPEPHKACVLDGVSVAYDDSGKGFPVVCLHATGHGGGDFGPFRERVAGCCRVIRLDWPGQGRSAVDHEAASADRYAALLGPFLDAIGVEAAVLVGNSIGGAAALAFAARHPERVRALVLANPGGLAPADAATRFVCRAMVAFFSAGVRKARWFGPAYRLYYRRILQEKPAHPRRREVAAAGYEVAAVLAQSWASFARPEADLTRLPAQISCPVWLPWAERDAIIAFRRSRPAVERFPQGLVEFFPGGHAAFLECPDDFAAGFLAFLEKNRIES